MKKKICFVVSSPLTIQAFLKEHINLLSKTYEISIVSNLEGNSLLELEKLPVREVKSIPIHRNISLIKDLKALCLLILFFRRNDFNAVHSITPKAGLICQLAAYLVNIENRIHIFTGQVWFTQLGFKRKVLMSIDKLIGRLTTHNLVDGMSQKEFLIKEKVLNQHKAIVLGLGSISGVDIHKFRKDDLERLRQRTKFGISKDAKVVLFLGRLNQDKGILDLVDAFNLLKVDFPLVFLVLAGLDEEGFAENIKDPKILFTGHVTSPEKMLPMADVFCLPSYREGFGTSVIEASSCSLPVLVSDTYGLRDTIISDLTGKRHRVGDVEDIHLKLIEMLINDKLLLEMGLEGRKYVEENFTSGLISKLWLDFYTKVLGGFKV